jgi:hypothetical protein
MDFLKDIDTLKVLVWVVPGAFITLFRSYAIRGSFPTVGKDDFAVFALGSVIYYFIVRLFSVDTNFVDTTASDWRTFAIIILIPAVVGFLLGMLEVRDLIGRFIRSVGIPIPAPDATAWEALFRDMPADAVLLVTLKNGSVVAGRWVPGRRGSAASSDNKTMDLYLGQVGAIKRGRTYVPFHPRRGMYVAAGEIRFIEVIAV